MEIKDITNDQDAINWIPNKERNYDVIVFETTIQNTLGVRYRDDNNDSFALIQRCLFLKDGDFYGVKDSIPCKTYNGAISDIFWLVSNYFIKEYTWESPCISNSSKIENFLLEVYRYGDKIINISSSFTYDNEGGHTKRYVSLEANGVESIVLQDSKNKVIGELKSTISAHNKEITINN